jgi:hypothetical protein
MDFYKIKERSAKNGVIEVYPDFIVCRSKDLMVRGRSFYAIWDEEKGLWSTDEYDVQRLIDKELYKYAEQVKNEQEIAEATNKKVEELFEKIRHKVKVATGQELVPNEYPKEYKDEWDRTYELRDSRASYPFNIANVKEFIEFCRTSNGFRIS